MNTRKNRPFVIKATGGMIMIIFNKAYAASYFRPDLPNDERIVLGQTMRCIVLFVFLNLFYCSTGYSQEAGRSYFPPDCHHIATNSFACNWKIIAHWGKISGKVIEFAPEPGRCGVDYVAAVALIRSGNDTIRAILECFRDTLQVGTRVVIKAVREPDCYVGISMDGAYYEAQLEKGRHIFRLSKYDETILKTVFAWVVKIK